MKFPQPKKRDGIEFHPLVQNGHGNVLLAERGFIRPAPREADGLNFKFLARQPRGEQGELFFGSRTVQRGNQQEKFDHENIVWQEHRSDAEMRMNHRQPPANFAMTLPSAENMHGGRMPPLRSQSRLILKL